MRFMVCVNNDEAVGMGDEQGLDDIEYEISELLRSGYYEVEYVSEIRDGE